MENVTPQKKAELQLELKKMYYETLELKTLPEMDIMCSRIKSFIYSNSYTSGIFNNCVEFYNTQLKTEAVKRKLRILKKRLNFLKRTQIVSTHSNGFEFNNIEILYFPLLKNIITEPDWEENRRSGQGIIYFYYRGIWNYLHYQNDLTTRDSERLANISLTTILDLGWFFSPYVAIYLVSEDFINKKFISHLSDTNFNILFSKAVLLSCLDKIIEETYTSGGNSTKENLTNMVERYEGEPSLKKVVITFLKTKNKEITAQKCSITVRTVEKYLVEFCEKNNIVSSQRTRGINALKEHFASYMFI